MGNRIAFAVISLILIFFLSLLAFNPGNIQTKYSTDSKFHFSQNSFDNNKIYKLKGNWEFYSSKTVETIDKTKDIPSLVQVPNKWTLYPNRDTSSPYGYAVYQCHVIVPEELKSKPFAIKTGKIGTAYSVYINNVKKFSSGVPSSTKTNAVPHYHPSVVLFDEKSSEYIISIFVSNFHDRTGGIWEDIYFGSFEDLSDFREKINHLDLFFAGGLFVFALYHMGLFLLHRKDISPLYFSLFCFLIGIRIFAIRENIFENTYHYFSWEIARKVEYFTYYLGTLVYFLFIYSLYKDLFAKYTPYIAIFLVSLNCSPVIFSNADFYSQFLTTAHIFNIYVILVPIYYVFKATLQKLPYSRIILYGLILLLASTINDILNAEQIIFTGNTIHVALFLFIFVQSFVLAEKFLAAYTLSENLLQENIVMYQQVKEMNEELEYKINLRTQELRDQLISKNRFVSILSHDMKGPLGSSILYMDFLYKQIENSIDAHSKKMFGVLKTSITGLHSMLNNILSTEIIKFSALPASDDSQSINKMVIDILNIFEGMINQKNIKTNMDAEEEYFTSSDVNAIQTILRNLISNAIKYTDTNGTISIVLKNFDSDFIEIIVQDTGIGINNQDILNIFSVEKKHSRRGTKGETGSGYGLMLAKDLVDSISGKIWVESEENKGTSFHFTVSKKTI